MEGNSFLNKKRFQKKELLYEENNIEIELNLDLMAKGIVSYYQFKQNFKDKLQSVELILVDKNWLKKNVIKYVNKIISYFKNKENINEKQIIDFIKPELQKEINIPIIEYPEKLYYKNEILYYNNYRCLSEETFNYFLKAFFLREINYNDFPKIYAFSDKNVHIIEYNNNFIDCQFDNFDNNFKEKFVSRYIIKFPNNNYNKISFINNILQKGLSFINSSLNNCILDKIKKNEEFYFCNLENSKIIEYSNEQNCKFTTGGDGQELNNFDEIEFNDCLRKMNEKIYKNLNNYYTKNDLLKALVYYYCFENLLEKNYNNNYYQNEYEVYLVDKIWINNFKNIYFYYKGKQFFKNNIHLLEEGNIINVVSFKEKFEKEIKIKTGDILEPMKFCKKAITSEKEINISYFLDFEFIDIYTFKCFEKLFEINADYPEIKCKINTLKDNIIIININNNTVQLIKYTKNKEIEENYLIISKKIKLIKNIIIENNLDKCFKDFNIKDKKNDKNIIIYKDDFLGDIYNINTIIEIYGFSNKQNNIEQFDNINNTKTTYINRKTKKNNNNIEKIILNKPLIGLDNIGATCYMNASLQCMSNIIELTKYFLKKDLNEIDKNKKPLSSAYQEVIYNLWPQDNNPYSINSYAPYNFKNIISKMNPLFKGIQANDSKDLIQFLLTEIHSELNKIKKNPNVNIDNLINNQFNFEQTFQNFSSFFMENYNSIISNLFYGMECHTTKCLSCNVPTFNIQCFNMLIFPLEKVRLFKGYNNEQYVTIGDCFECHRNVELLDGPNQIYCNNCHLNSNAFNNTSLVFGPNVLIINLNRGKGLQFNVKLNFELNLDISNFVLNAYSPKQYELIGIVMHYGESSMSGHYIAFCKNKFDNNWYKYNDSIVTKVNINDLYSSGIPYLLFYHKI